MFLLNNRSCLHNLDDTFVGGILILTTDDFHQLNGLSNKYWVN